MDYVTESASKLEKYFRNVKNNKEEKQTLTLFTRIVKDSSLTQGLGLKEDYLKLLTWMRLGSGTDVTENNL